MGGGTKRARTNRDNPGGAQPADQASDSRMQTRVVAEIGQMLPNRVLPVVVGMTYARAAAEMANEHGRGELDVASRHYVPPAARDELEGGRAPEWLRQHTEAIAKEFCAAEITADAVLSENGVIPLSDIEAQADADRSQRRLANGDSLPINGLAAYVSSRYNSLPDDPDERGRADFERALWLRLQSVLRPQMRQCGTHLMDVYESAARCMAAMGGVATDDRTILDKNGLTALATRACEIAVTDEAYVAGVTKACEYPWTTRIEKMGDESIGVRVAGVVKMDDPITVSHMDLMLHSAEMHPRWMPCSRGLQCIFNVPTGAGSSVEVSYSAPKPAVVGYLTAKEAAGTVQMPKQARPCIRCILQFMAIAYAETVRIGYLTPAFVTPICFAKGSRADEFPPDVFFPETEPGNSVHVGMSQIVNVDQIAFVAATTTIENVTYQHYRVQFGGNFPTARTCMTTR
jgi:hypothetical protein